MARGSFRARISFACSEYLISEKEIKVSTLQGANEVYRSVGHS